jgi:hypothetical protein
MRILLIGLSASTPMFCTPSTPAFEEIMHARQMFDKPRFDAVMIQTRLGLVAGALAVIAMLGGCATRQKNDSPAAVERRAVPELMALRPKDFNTRLTSREGEAEVFAAEVAAIRAAFALPDGVEANEKLPGAMANAAIFNVEKDLARSTLLRLLPTAHEKTPDYLRTMLSAAHTQFWNEAAPLISPLLPKIKTPREFAIAAYTLLRSDASAPNKTLIATQMRSSFPDWQNEARLRALEHRLRLDVGAELAQRPSLVELLAAPIRAGYPVVFSFQRRDRERPGLAMVRGADGRFVRNVNGSFFTIVQLAFARTNLPGTITNGNTPQGLFVIKGTGTATNKWIGPTPFLESVLPIEAKLSLFEHGTAAESEVWTEARYESFLPPSWKNYFPIKEAFLAGLAGRDEILAHGNAVNPAYYRDEPYFPAAPSAGCLVAAEYWSKEDGTLVHSDQLALVKAFVSGGKDIGYLIVVEIDDRPRAVVLADVVEAVIAAERRAR